MRIERSHEWEDIIRAKYFIISTSLHCHLTNPLGDEDASHERGSPQPSQIQQRQSLAEWCVCLHIICSVRNVCVQYSVLGNYFQGCLSLYKRALYLASFVWQHGNKWKATALPHEKSLEMYCHTEFLSILEEIRYRQNWAKMSTTEVM